jgi:hypothetical protein
VQGKLPWTRVSGIEAEQACAARGGHLCTTTEWQNACTLQPGGPTTCGWAYAPPGPACTVAIGPPYPVPAPNASFTKYCNLLATYDFDPTQPGQQGGLLVTGSAALNNCYADWTGAWGNSAANAHVYDLNGNAAELAHLCNADQTACAVAADCCSGSCINGTCGCKGAGMGCVSASNCCSGVCTLSKCVGGVAGSTPMAYAVMGGSYLTEDERGAACTFQGARVDQNWAQQDVGFRCCFSIDPTQ